ncbi:PAH-inducible cytochrome P450 monooxygenase PC-PAH 1 [Irpex rosettiformis]|uniref:PAH-inducible cytochrome P450 monooxygenase PC-PAH 1 n=1 Tax=Irpex rosettiformis TaxID=378272 RepID=A0ACB8U1R2_9APHY|nr:PAH-inducible cytochrome P450 monooxygenase PC-PAH 1 [Irpex rosettiformis]
MSTTTYVPAALLLVVCCYMLFRRLFRYSIKHIRGPTGSFLRGNMRDFFYQTNVGDMDFQFTKDYGLVWRMEAPFGQDILAIADPKALQHMFHKSGYNYGKNAESLVGTNLLIGKSILYSPNNHVHARHRKVMNPAFSAPQLRSFLPLFRRSAIKLCQLLKEEILQESVSDGQLVAMNKWLSRTTLDVIGESAFQFEFGALDNSKNEVSEAYENLFVKTRMHPPILDTIFRATWRFLPLKLLEFVKYLPRREYSGPGVTRRVVDKVASSLVDQAIKDAEKFEIEKGKKDVMSVLVRANMSENPSLQLSKKEMMAQMGALILAGHETTANTLAWMLWELAKHSYFQNRLRDEIRDKRKDINSRNAGTVIGNVDFCIDDLESMPFLQAVVKETMRFHPIVYHLIRAAKKDDVIPLSKPITTSNRDVIDQVPIAKGQNVLVSICAYNRIKEIWGEDADEFNPMRFIEGRIKHEFKVGMYANLMTFSAGMRGCIGWRFSLIEMQAIIVALVENFEFAVPPKEQNTEVVRKPLGLMSPMVKGRQSEGVLMPLIVKAL